MVTFEEAKSIALKANSKVNACHEYKQAFHFLDAASDADGDNSVVILKASGAAKHFVDFILNYQPERDYIEREM